MSEKGECRGAWRVAGAVVKLGCWHFAFKRRLSWWGVGRCLCDTLTMRIRYFWIGPVALRISRDAP